MAVFINLPPVTVIWQELLTDEGARLGDVSIYPAIDKECESAFRGKPSLMPTQLQKSGLKATAKSERLIDDGTRGWHDWYLLNWNHPPLWTATTRKLKDPKWRGPDGATLHLEVKCLTDNKLVLTFNCNAWGAINPGKPAIDYIAVKELKGSPEWQQISVSLQDIVSLDAKAAPLTNWLSVTEFSISPSGTTLKEGKKVKVDGKAWQGPREIRNLRWVGGEYKGQ